MIPPRHHWLPSSALLLLAAVACGPASGPTDAPVVDTIDVDPDSDDIVTAHEGEADPDEDLIPAYRDRDSDDDGLPDRLEAGDDDPATFPVDSDGDQVPDFLDLDSDDNGRPARVRQSMRTLESHVLVAHALSGVLTAARLGDAAIYIPVHSGGRIRA